MAVYKPTYCYPLLDSLDVRVVANASDYSPYLLLKCKIDSSNKRVTGYKIKILDGENNQIFPSLGVNNGAGFISPVSELPVSSIDEYLNSGWNGTSLEIPFFQNYNYYGSNDLRLNNIKMPSFNAIYYTPRYMVSYVLDEEDLQYWTPEVQGSNIIIKPEEGWKGIINGEVAIVGETVLLLEDITVDGITAPKGIWKITSGGYLEAYRDADLNRVVATTTVLFQDQTFLIVVKNAKYHNHIFKWNSSNFEDITDNLGDNFLWQDIYGNPIDLNIEGGNYKWEITLYQGVPEEQTEEISVYGYGRKNTVIVKHNDYSNLDFEWYDSLLGSGTILGSTSKRIQIASKPDSGVIPVSTMNNPLVLQGKYMQLYEEEILGSHSGDKLNKIGQMAYVQNYDTTLGHVYPISNVITPALVDSASHVAFFKHSTNAEDVLASEKVAVATTKPLELYLATKQYSNLGVLTQEQYDQYPANSLYVKSGDDYVVSTSWAADTTYYEASTTYTFNPSLGLPIIDGYVVKENDLILVKDQINAYENGIYVARPEGSNWYRSGSYNSWGDFLGVIILVLNQGLWTVSRKEKYMFYSQCF